MLRLPFRLILWLFGGFIRSVVILVLLLGVIYLVMRLTPLDEFWRARGYARIGQEEEAIRWYKLGLQRYPTSKYISQGHYELARLLFDRARYQEAIFHFGKALNGTLPLEMKREALLLIAEAFLKDKKPLQAAERFERFASLFPEDKRIAKALFLAGESYRKVNRLTSAERCWQKVSRRYPSSPFAPEAVWALASLKDEKGNTKEAMQLYLKLIKRYPNSSQAGKANIRLAILHYRLGDYKSAIKSYANAIKSTPQLLQDALRSEALQRWWQKIKQQTETTISSKIKDNN